MSHDIATRAPATASASTVCKRTGNQVKAGEVGIVGTTIIIYRLL
jgi:hypothetical protein